MAEIETPPNSILGSVKKGLGVADDYTVYDLDLIMYINTAFMTLQQLGVGPENGYVISGPENVWAEFMQDEQLWGGLRTYLVLKTRLLFDPPSLSFVLSAIQKQTEELEWRLRSQVKDTPGWKVDREDEDE